MSFMGDQKSIPAVMFHSIGLEQTDWIYRHLSMPVSLFEDRIAYLSAKGWNFIHWAELHDHMAGKRKIPLPAIMLTFDDGYLDNWVYAFPVLKKYGAKATIFVNPEFADPGSEIRPTTEVIGDAPKPAAAGFLNWEEMRAMEASGLVDIQSHALTHTWYYSSPQIEGFHHPQSKKYPWLAWNAKPERKPYYMSECQAGFVPWGTPVYAHDKALVCRRYFPSSEVIEGMTAFVNDKGGESYFESKDWKNGLLAHHQSLMKQFGHHGQYETDDEYTSRITNELMESKRLIETFLQKRVDYICWPGGGYNRTVLVLARQAGYKAWTLASKDQSNFRNRIGSGPERIKRMGCIIRFQLPGCQHMGYASSRYFYYGVERHKGSLFHTTLGRILLAGEYLKHIAGLK